MINRSGTFNGVFPKLNQTNNNLEQTSDDVILFPANSDSAVNTVNLDGEQAIKIIKYLIIHYNDQITDDHYKINGRDVIESIFNKTGRAKEGYTSVMLPTDQSLKDILCSSECCEMLQITYKNILDNPLAIFKEDLGNLNLSSLTLMDKANIIHGLSKLINSSKLDPYNSKFINNIIKILQSSAVR